jgi:DNA end-binding protein Ku
MPTSVWKGMITFGLVAIPIRLYAAARTKHTSFNQLHKECNTRIKQPQFCPHCNRFVNRNEIVKGYEHDKDQYVLIDEEDIKKIAPPSEKNMEILSFVEESKVDPIYFDSSNLAVPEPQATKAYQLLVKALADTKMLGIAKMTMHQREYTVFLRPRSGGITLHTMFYANEIAAVDEYGKTDNTKPNPVEIKLAEQLIQTLAGDFHPQEFADQYQSRLNEMIEAKLKGKSISVSPEAPQAPVIDIMEALKKSLAASEARRPKSEAKPAQPKAEPKAVPISAARRPRRKTG